MIRRYPSGERQLSDCEISGQLSRLRFVPPHYRKYKLVWTILRWYDRQAVSSIFWDGMRQDNWFGDRMMADKEVRFRNALREAQLPALCNVSTEACLACDTRATPCASCTDRAIPAGSHIVKQETQVMRWVPEFIAAPVPGPGPLIPKQWRQISGL